MNPDFPHVRMRRYRKTSSIRGLLDNVQISQKKLIWPVFVKPGSGIKEPIPSLPMQHYLSPDVLYEEVAKVCDMGVSSVLLFPVVPTEIKTADGSYILQREGLMAIAVASLKKQLPNVTVFVDLDMSEYTNHGHSGIIDAEGIVQNDETLSIISKAAPILLETGADGIAPSGMIDGQVSVIRKSLIEAQMDDRLILSYSTKFASTFYEAFRMAARNTPKFGHRQDCQLPITDVRQAIRESLLDEQEGADLLMVKPALCYLDVIQAIRKRTDLPLGAYNVSGEYNLTWNATKLNIGDSHKMAHEILTSIFRSGADFVITYWSNQIREVLNAYK